MSKTYKLGDICTIGSSKRVHLSDYVKSGVPFYRSKEIIELANGQNITEPLYISNEQYNEIKRRFPVPKKNDILITSVGTIGVSYLVKDESFYFKDGNLTWLSDIDESIVNIVFLTQWLKSNFFKKQILNNNIGAVQKAITIDYLRKVNITLPDLFSQQKIASVLSTLDAKIELNNKINSELEAMAKTLYDYWFVQFDFPDEDGNPYKSSGGKMVWSEELKREIPEEWEVKKLKEVADTGSGGTPKSTIKEFYENGNIPWINSGELNSPYIVSTTNFITEEGLNNASTKLFPNNTILMAMYGATAGKTSIISFEASTNQAICAIMPFDKEMFYYTKFSLDDMYKYLVNLSSGSARDNLSQDKIRILNICIPEKKILLKYSDITTKFFEQIKNNLLENQKLAEVRDFLLPMLMNGQVVVT